MVSCAPLGASSATAIAGRRVVVSSGTRDKTLALRKESEIIEALHRNPQTTQADVVALVTGGGMNRHKAAIRAEGGLTVKEAFDRCLKSPTVWQGIKAHAEYARNCRAIEEILDGDTPLASIDYHAVQKLTNGLMAKPLPGSNRPGQTLSGATVNNHLACLRRMFNVALEDHWPDAPSAFPEVKSVKKRKGRGYFMGAADERAIFQAVLDLDKARPDAQGGHPRKLDAHRHHLLFVVLVESGMRLSEALGSCGPNWTSRVA